MLHFGRASLTLEDMTSEIKMSDSTRNLLNVQGGPPFTKADLKALPDLGEMMRSMSNVIGDFIDLSIWLADREEGARLVTAYAPSGADPSTFQVTAMMFFAMEEMSQISKSRYAYVVIDEKTSLVGIRNDVGGELIGVVLFVGRGAGILFEQDALDLAKAATPLFAESGAGIDVGPSPADFREVIAAMAYELSVSRANTLTRNVNFTGEGLPDLPDVSQLDSVYCVLTGKTLRVTLRISLDQVSGRGITSMSKGVPITHVTPQSSLDFMKEVANLISGGLQKYLQDQGVLLGIGLPLAVAAGGVTPSILRKTPFSFIWKLNGEGMSIICSLGVMVSFGRLFEHLRLPDFNQEREIEGDVELL